MKNTEKVLYYCERKWQTREKGVLVCHGDCFYMPHTFRMTLSHGEDLEKGLALIDEYLEEVAERERTQK